MYLKFTTKLGGRQVETQIIKIANDLNTLSIHSKENVRCDFGTSSFEDEVYLFFYHYSDEYDAEVKSILFVNFIHQKNFVTNSN